MWRLISKNLLKSDLMKCGKNVTYLSSYPQIYMSSFNPKSDLWHEYNTLKSVVEATPLPRDKDPTAVYCNNELDLREIDVYGFDYDYTLACYTKELHPLIYDLAQKKLVHELKYPKNILEFSFDPTFAIRGLHCDIEKGILMKIDAFHNYQQGSAYRGLKPVSDAEMKELYQGTHLNLQEMSNYYGFASKGAVLCQLMDLFAMPEMTLFANVIEYFDRNEMPCSPDYIFHDVRHVVQSLHSSGLLHKMIMDDLERFVGRDKQVAEVIRRLSAANKKLFLITNSGFPFVDSGMRYLMGPEWTDMFDVIIVNARKPKFFNESKRPFRLFDRVTQQKSWYPINKLKKGNVYQEGNLFMLRDMMGWYGDRVLYFGDHVYTDLADATIKHGWRTGAIIPELEHEIKGLNSDEFKRALRWKLALENLIQQKQVHEDPESQKILDNWHMERNLLRIHSKNIFNSQFGSIFRTFDNPTYFSRRLNRFADVYTSSVVNLLNYSTNHTFYTTRSALPHEFQIPVV